MAADDGSCGAGGGPAEADGCARPVAGRCVVVEGVLAAAADEGEAPTGLSAVDCGRDGDAVVSSLAFALDAAADASLRRVSLRRAGIVVRVV